MRKLRTKPGFCGVYGDFSGLGSSGLSSGGFAAFRSSCLSAMGCKIRQAASEFMYIGFCYSWLRSDVRREHG